jgi:hypothetical protein
VIDRELVFRKMARIAADLTALENLAGKPREGYLSSEYDELVAVFFPFVTTTPPHGAVSPGRRCRAPKVWSPAPFGLTRPRVFMPTTSSATTTWRGKSSRRRNVYVPGRVSGGGSNSDLGLRLSRTSLARLVVLTQLLWNIP